MPFTNEYYTEADNEKYDLIQICSEHNIVNRNYMHSRTWTINRQREAFLIKTWSHLHSKFSGYAFYWKGEWMFFEMHPSEQKLDKANNSCWFRFLVKDFVVPHSLKTKRYQILDDLHMAIASSPGGPDYNYGNLEATIDFIGEN